MDKEYRFERSEWFVNKYNTSPTFKAKVDTYETMMNDPVLRAEHERQAEERRIKRLEYEKTEEYRKEREEADKKYAEYEKQQRIKYTNALRKLHPDYYKMKNDLGSLRTKLKKLTNNKDEEQVGEINIRIQQLKDAMESYKQKHSPMVTVKDYE
jgi:uncharacterized protein YpuA (DUF1002 family)